MTTQFRALASMLFALAAVFFFVDLNKAQAVDIPAGHKIKQATPNDKKDEVKRSEILNEKNEHVSTLIEYKNGKHEIQVFRLDGSLKSSTITEGESVKHTDFYPPDANGMSLKMRETVNDTVRFERRKLADGTYEAIRYKRDGKRPQMLRRVGPKGEFELIHYRTGTQSTPWFKVSIPGTSGEFEYQYFAKDGSRVRRVMGDKTMIVTAYNKDGDFWYEQVWDKVDDENYTLNSLTTKHTSGLRRYVLDKDGKTLNKVEDLNLAGDLETTWQPTSVDAPAPELLQEVFESDDPTIP
ncbi:MAG: hypothetical protein K2W82_17660 [Candidatus Obscuribacterales bacterium]|nr:hypothetical protein [Candidatus Obscuribacterales bacterium]